MTMLIILTSETIIAVLMWSLWDHKILIGAEGDCALEKLKGGFEEGGIKKRKIRNGTK
jgi:hypothetical protein